MTRIRRARGARGQTLFEVVVVVALLSLVMTMVYKGIDSATNAITGTEKRLANLDEARVLMAVTTKDLRTATRLQPGTSPFVLADSREVVFYANLNNDGSGSTVVANGPRKVRIYVDASSQLIEQVTKPDAASVPPAYTYNGAATNRFVGRFIANTASNPIFRYFDSNGNELTPEPLSATARLGVDSVQIMLSIRKSTTLKVANTTLLNTVRLPNVDYQNTFGG
ncbi:MAG TPA: prepilin-type N-terminal cleavage/methylation domain-containing protein [Acidimicrobiia bacterium]